MKSWDGRSPLDVQIDVLVEVATNYIRHTRHKQPEFVRLELTSQILRSGDRFYFFTVTFTLPNDEFPDDFPETMEVVVTLDYTVIEPDIRYFDNDDEYQRYMVWQKLINQVGRLDPHFKLRVDNLSREQLWKLDIALWSFTSAIDLCNWLNSPANLASILA